MQYELNDNFLPEYFVGPELRGVVETVTNSAVMLTQAEIAKRTGFLASTVHGSTSVEPVLKGEDRWVGSVDVGGQGSAATADYGASYEFGAGNHPGSTGRHTNQPAHILDRVREELGGL